MTQTITGNKLTTEQYIRELEWLLDFIFRTLSDDSNQPLTVADLKKAVLPIWKEAFQYLMDRKP